MLRHHQSRLATATLLLGVAFWGATFAFVKEVLDFMDVFSFMSIRFLLASFILSVIFIKRFKHYSYKVLKKGVLIGSVLTAGFFLQTLGIKYTTASNAGFIAGLEVVLIPIFVACIDRQIPSYRQIMATLLAFIGLSLLTFKAGFKTQMGDLLVLGSTFVFVIYIIMIKRGISNIDAAIFSITQFFTVSIQMGILGLLINGKIAIPDKDIVWQIILFCAIFATAYMYTTLSFMMKYMSELKAAIIFSFEPLFAAIFAYWYLNEVMPKYSLLGGILIYLGVLCSEVKIKFLKIKKHE